MTWNGELFDTDGFHSTTTNTSRITIPSGKAGKYLVVGAIDFDNNGTGYRQLQINKNGTLWSYVLIIASSVSYPSATLTSVLDLEVGDYVELATYQNSGSNQTHYITGSNGEFSAVYLGA